MITVCRVPSWRIEVCFDAEYYGARFAVQIGSWLVFVGRKGGAE